MELNIVLNIIKSWLTITSLLIFSISFDTMSKEIALLFLSLEIVAPFVDLEMANI